MYSKYDIRKQIQEVIGHVIVHICHTPGGYVWWQGLPEKGKKGKKACKRHWGRLFRQNLYTTEMMHGMVLACFDVYGVTPLQSRRLKAYVLKTFYGGKEERLFKAWLKIRKDTYGYYKESEELQRVCERDNGATV